MKEQQFLTLFRNYIFNNHRTQKAASEHWGVSGNFVSMIAKGVKSPTEQMLKDVGFSMDIQKETIRTYQRECK
tara:strand:+ start:447 stop:665 length:219 start_codon:yes stop_codon:yes gene_type:complete